MTVFTGSVPTLPALHKPTAAELAAITGALQALSDPWTAYTPTWTSTAGTPSFGNATVKARYQQVGKLVRQVTFIQFGSTSTYGTAGGFWRFTLPVTQSDVDLGVGAALIYDASVPGAQLPGTVLFAGSGLSHLHGSAGEVGQGAPFTFTTGDRLWWHLCYEAA